MLSDLFKKGVASTASVGNDLALAELKRACAMGDQDACRQVATLSRSANVQKLAEGGMSFLSPDMEEEDMDYEEESEDELLPLLDTLGEEKSIQLLEAIDNYPVVKEIAEMAIKTSDGEVEGMGGETEDMVPARLSDGEFVFSAAAVKAIGLEKLEALHDEAKRIAASQI